MIEEILKKIDENKKEVVKYTQDLIKIKTVNPPGECYEDCAKYLFEKLEEISCNPKIISVPSKDFVVLDIENYPRLNVLGWYKKETRKPELHLSGHFDVVPPGKRWRVSPFVPKIENGKMYGLGTSDQKGGIASILYLLKILKSLDVELKGNISVSFTPDEETGGYAGLGYLVEKNMIKSDYAIITEPSQPNLIKIGHRGALWLELITRGKTAHGSMAFMGINAFEKMVKVATELKNLEVKFAKKKSKYPTQFPQEKHPMIMLGGVVGGGVKTNVVPDECRITVDRRLIPEEKIEDAMNEIEEVLMKLRRDGPELYVKAKKIIEVEATAIEENERIVQSVARNHKKIYRKNANIIISPGFNDSRFLINQAKIPAITYGPGILKMAHMPDEYILIDDLIKTTKVLALVCWELLS
ncbi:MAG: M20 family metallopeptidase [Candidatus Methanofastidiosia archaeon]